MPVLGVTSITGRAMARLMCSKHAVLLRHHFRQTGVQVSPPVM